MATANPAMNESVYQRAGFADASTSVMTLEGTVFKTAVLLVILMGGAICSWTPSISTTPLSGGLMTIGFLGGFVMAMVTIFVPRISPYTSPVYAGLEGLALGGVSSLFEKSYPGIAIQAVGLTFGVLAVMLGLYGTRIVQVTEKFKIGVIAATGAICLVYLVDMVMSFFGARIHFIHDAGWVGIGFSLVVVGIAALNLILDFDFIEQGVRRQAPKYMEWYGAFSLMVTLVWMYLEILRLLAKTRGGSRN
ncbi:MAG TPA: Bax inhibitor-1/YccA family protein [Planctomycetaceae bacterium]|jgi:uncharacterized YccA/Bax inhibitor family protein|nr:Bax inhibitor-1/YccA family protein [Planctomycetaceae bacterium]